MTKKQETNGEHKPVIETIINTCALAMSSLGMIRLNDDNYIGFVLIIFAAGLEFFKYWGRKKKLW